MQTLNAEPGQYYTQRDLEDERNRVFINKATLAFSISPDDYILWTAEQKQQWESQYINPLADEYANTEPEE